MKIHRFIFDFDPALTEITISDPEIINQIKNVLRLKAGETVIICDGNGLEAKAKISCLSEESLVLSLDQIIQGKKPLIETILYCSLLKSDKFEFAAQKSTEAGINTIVPVIAKRTVKLNIKYFRIQDIIREAAEQSGRTIVPLLCHPIKFEEAVNDAGNNQVNYFFDMPGKIFDYKKLDANKKINRIGIFIGPEGGWESNEVRLAEERGFKIVSLGKLTLRAETAAIIASYLVSSHF